MVSIRCLHQLRRYPQVIVGLPHTAFEYCLDAKLLTNLTNIASTGLVLER